MHFLQSIENIRNIIINPMSAWDKIKDLNISKRDFYLTNVIGILAILFWGRLFGTSLELLAVSSIYYISVYSLLYFLSDFISFFFSVLAIKTILPSYSKVKEFEKKTIILIYYSLIPFYIISFIVSIFPSMYFFSIIAAYGIYIFYTGIKKLFIIQDKDISILLTISFIIIIGIHILVRFVFILPFNALL